MIFFSNNVNIKLFLGYQLYSAKCVQEGVVTQEEVKKIYDDYQKICEESLQEAQKETSMKVNIKMLFIPLFLFISYCKLKV